MLDINFANVGNFLVRCPAFSIAYPSQRGLGLMHLCHAIEQRGIEWETRAHTSAHLPNAMHEICTPCAAAYFFLDPRELSGYQYFYNGLDFQDLCICGACPSCTQPRLSYRIPQITLDTV